MFSSHSSTCSCPVFPAAFIEEAVSAPLYRAGLLYFSDGILTLGFPRWFSGKESACNAEDLSSSPGSGRFPGEGNDDPF